MAMTMAAWHTPTTTDGAILAICLTEQLGRLHPATDKQQKQSMPITDAVPALAGRDTGSWKSIIMLHIVSSLFIQDSFESSADAKQSGQVRQRR